MKKKHAIPLAVLAIACASQLPVSTLPVKKASVPVKVSIQTGPVTGQTKTAPIAIQSPKWKVPHLIMPPETTNQMNTAGLYLSKYANSDKFYVYVRSHVTDLKGGNETSVDHAITKARECLNTLPPIEVKWKSYPIWNRGTVMGGWDGKVINQNPGYVMNEIERAGHWYHEIMHACGFTHDGNNIKTEPIILESWPYKSGYAFEDFIIETQKTLAGAR